MKLPYRDEKHPDESIGDYIDRLSYWNGYSNPIKFREILSRFHDEAYGNPWALGGGHNSTSKLSEDPVFHWERYLHCQWRGRQNSRTSYRCILALEKIFQRNIHRSQLNMGGYCDESFRICGQCWADSSYLRFYWGYPEYKVCHIHRENILHVQKFNYGIQADDLHGIGESVQSDSLVSNCDVAEAAIKKFSRSDFAWEKIEAELRRRRYIRALIEEIGDVFKKWCVYLCVEDVIVTLNSRDYVGMSMHVLMEAVFSTLLKGNESCETAARVLAVLNIGKQWRDGCKIGSLRTIDREIHYWSMCEGFSITPLFYAYMGFCALQGRQFRFWISEEISGFEGVDGSTDWQLTNELFSLGLLWPYKRQDDEDWCNYQRSFNGSSLRKSYVWYSEYLRKIGKRSVDDLAENI